MLIQTRSMIIQKGYSDQVVERWSGPSPIMEMPGLIDFSVMVNKRNKEQEEVLVIIRWESEEAWKNWEKAMYISKATVRKNRKRSQTI